jgi:hypothetical protein
MAYDYWISENDVASFRVGDIPEHGISKLCVFSSLSDHFFWSLTFPALYIFWNVHDVSTFSQNIMGGLKSYMYFEMPCSGISPTLKLATSFSEIQ